MKELGLIIDFNQPLVNEESVIKRSITDFYNPLVRLLKSYKNVSFSLNFPLSTLELWEKYEALDLISSFKEMYQVEKFELINSSPYGLPLTGLPTKIIESQLILNEYGIGYYLGSRQGFEGEPSIMLRDVMGFLPTPNDLVGENVLKTLLGFDYSWFAVKSPNLKEFLFEVEDNERVIKGVNIVDGLDSVVKSIINNEGSYVNSEDISGNISEEINKLFQDINDSKNDTVVVLLSLKNDEKLDIDYKYLFVVYESILDSLSKKFDQVKNVGDILKYKNKLKRYTLDDYVKELKTFDIDNGADSKSGAYFIDMLSQKMLSLNSDSVPFSSNGIDEDVLSTIKLWDLDHINTFNDATILNNTCLLMIVSRLVPLMCLKDSKYFLEEESLMSLLNEETHNYVKKLLSYIDDKDISEYLKGVN